MSAMLRPRDESRAPRSPSASMVIIGIALDTTWRIFIPTLGGTFLGIWLDTLFDSAPWGVLVCLGLGTVLTAWLIIRQLTAKRKK